MVSPCLLPLFSLLPFLHFSSSSPDTITLSLSPFTTTPSPTTTPWQNLNHLTSSSRSWAHHIKNPHQKTTLTKTPLSPRSYGAYSISLSFGSPPQTLDFIMDTGSSLVWFPCTRLYICSRCNFPNVNPTNISTFVPKSSSTAKILSCKNPKCGDLFGSDVQARCQSTQKCPDYLVQYSSGTTAGSLLSETLVFSNINVTNFAVGCSIYSDNQPCGIAGFGRGPASLPAQMGLKKFSYCLISHRFDDMPEVSQLILFLGYDSAGMTAGRIRYTPFVNPLNSNPKFQDYYYVNLRKITVGREHVKVPYKYLLPASDGNGGTVVDSGTTFTYMDNEVFEMVAHEFEKQMANYSRVTLVEIQSGLRPCYNVSKNKSVTFPDLVFEFKGRANVEFPLADYFSLVDDASVVCMTIVSNNPVGPASSGPAIIIGNYQQQNFYVEYDLMNNRLGFRKQICK